MAKQRELKTCCVHLPRQGFDEATAIVVTTWNIVPVNFARLILNELHDVIHEPLSFELYIRDRVVHFCYTANPVLSHTYASALYPHIEDAIIRDFPDFTHNLNEDTQIAAADITLARPNIYPLQDLSDITFDTMQPTCAALSQIPAHDRMILQLVCKAVKDTSSHQLSLRTQFATDQFLQMFRTKYWFKRGVRENVLKRIHEKMKERMYSVSMRIVALRDKAHNKSDTPPLEHNLHSFMAALSFINSVDENRYVLGKIRNNQRAILPFQNRNFTNTFKLTSKELASTWHVPSLGSVPNTLQVQSKRATPPPSLPMDQDNEEISFFGQSNYRDANIPFGIQREDRRRHFYILGKSGTGKSSLLQLLIQNDIEAGHGVAVLDPHGDLVDNVLKIIPHHRISDVVLFDPSDTSFPPSFSPFALVSSELKMRSTIGFIEIFRKIFGDTWNDHMDYVIRYSTLALLCTPGATLLSFRKFLLDKDYRDSILSSVKDQAVLNYWNDEFVKRESEIIDRAVTPITNRLGQLIATDTLRNIFGQPMNRYDFRGIMDRRKILLMKVSKGVLGNDNSALIGAMVISKIYEAAMSRADISPEQRNDFYFYVDEFHNFATESFGEILSEARKYSLNLTFANQFLSQLSKPMRDTIFGNVGNVLSFRVGGEDSAIIAQEMQPVFSSEDIINLAIRDFVMKMLVKGEVQNPFSGRTLEVVYPPTEEQYGEECLNYSRENYALPLEQVRSLLEVWDRES